MPTPVLRAAFAAVLLGLAAVSAAADKPSIKQSSEQLDRVRSRIQQLNRSIEADRGRQDSLQNQLESAERAVAAAKLEVQHVADDIDRQNAKLKQAEQQRDAAQHRLDKQKQALAAQLRAAYMIGGGGRTGLVLNQDDPGRISRMVGYYDYLNRARAQRIADIQDELKKLAELQKQVEQQSKALQSLQKQRSQALAELQKQHSARAEAVAALKTRLAGESGELNQLRANEKQLQALLESLKRALASTPFEGGGTGPFAKQRGKLPWPLHGRILANYGDPKAGGRLEWKGLWISADEGAPIHAVAQGRVAYVGWMSRYGLIIVLEHQGGYFTLYGHAGTVNTTAGDVVAPGDVIGTAGSTGGYEQPGLYFEIRKGTDPLNPNSWLK